MRLWTHNMCQVWKFLFTGSGAKKSLGNNPFLYIRKYVGTLYNAVQLYRTKTRFGFAIHYEISQH